MIKKVIDIDLTSKKILFRKDAQFDRDIDHIMNKYDELKKPGRNNLCQKFIEDNNSNLSCLFCDSKDFWIHCRSYGFTL